jgi:hypothetical protein
MGNGGWGIGHRELKIENWLLGNGELGIGHRELGIGYWLLSPTTHKKTIKNNK